MHSTPCPQFPSLLFTVHHSPFCCYICLCLPSCCAQLSPMPYPQLPPSFLLFTTPFLLLHPLVFALSLCPTLASLFAGEVYMPFCCSPLPFSLQHPFVFAFCHLFLLCPTLTSLFTGEVHMFFAVHHFPFHCDTCSCLPCITSSHCAQLSLHFSPVKFTLYLLIFADCLFFLLCPNGR